MPRKNVEDELRAVNNARLHDILNISLLRRGKIVVEENELRLHRSGSPAYLLQLAFADQSCGIGPITALEEFTGDFRSRTFCERAQFVQRLLGAELRHGRRFRSSGDTGGSVTRSLCSRCAGALDRFLARHCRCTLPIFQAHQEGAFRGLA
jgi:hypothetical protein